MEKEKEVQEKTEVPINELWNNDGWFNSLSEKEQAGILAMPEREQRELISVPASPGIKAEKPQKRKAKKSNIKIKDASEINQKIDKKIKEKPALSLPELKIKPEEFNQIVHAGTTTISYLVKKEPVSLPDTALFSSQLFNICKINGWLEMTNILPYVFLAGATIDLSVKIMNQPDTVQKKVISERVKKDETIQVVDNDALELKIKGQDKSLTPEERKRKLAQMGGIYER